jgi:hypothetical protein
MSETSSGRQVAEEARQQTKQLASQVGEETKSVARVAASQGHETVRADAPILVGKPINRVSSRSATASGVPSVDPLSTTTTGACSGSSLRWSSVRSNSSLRFRVATTMPIDARATRSLLPGRTATRPVGAVGERACSSPARSGS